MNDRPVSYMRDSDAFTWQMEKDPLLRSTIVGVLVLDGAVDYDTLLERLDRSTRVIHGFRHRVVLPPLRLATPRWVVDPDFDLTWHVRRFQAAEPRTLESVFDFARKTGMAGFDRDRPLWEFTLIEGLADGSSALVIKVHHALTDGVGGMDVCRVILDLEPDPVDAGAMPPAPEGEPLDPASLAWDAIGHNGQRLVGLARESASATVSGLVNAVRRPRQTVSDVLSTGVDIARFVRPVSETLSPVMTERHLASHFEALEVPLDEMLRAAHAADVRHNDAFLAAVTGGLRRYHEKHGAEVEELRAVMPVNIRKPGDPVGGNRITLMRLKLPVGLADPVERMAQTQERCGVVRADRSLPYTDRIAGALNLLPRGYVGGMLKHIDFLASNVPGVPIPFYLAGAKVTGFHSFGPTIGAAVNITLLSYCGTCFVGVNMDTGAIPDPDVFMDALRAGFDEVLAVGR